MISQQLQDVFTSSTYAALNEFTDGVNLAEDIT